MFSHYFKTAFRSILHRKLYSTIAALSLAVGLTVSILILSFVRFENGFDSMHFDAERTYRLNWITADGSHFATFMNPLSPVLTSAIPEIESYTRVAMRQHLFTVDDVDQYQTLSMVDGSFFDFFQYEAIAGDPAVAIQDVTSAVITEAAAVQLFSTVDAVGRSFTVDGQYNYRVAAIIGNNHGNSHLVSNIYVNNEQLPQIWNYAGVWNNMGSDVMYHYIKLAPGADPDRVADDAMTFYRENISDQATFSIALQPLLEIHFTADLQNEMTTRDDISGTVKPFRQESDIFIFSGVGVLTLFIAAFNFMNLQAVQLTRRVREIAVRRVAGSSNRELITQFLVETGVIALFALLLAILLCELFLPYFTAMVASSMDTSTFITLPNLGMLAVMAIIVGLLAGAYPAISAARLTPADTIKGEMVKGDGKNRFRSGLIIAQFSISIGLIIASGIVNTQINYALQKSLGFNPENVVTVEMPNGAIRQAYDVFHDRLLSQPGIVSVSSGSIIPTRDLSDGGSLLLEGGDPNSPLIYRSVNITDDYFSTLQMEVIAGRALDSDYPTDAAANFSDTVTTRSGGMMLNATAARAAGFTNPADAVGANFYSEGEFQGRIYHSDLQVVGVLEDAHFQSVRTDIVPVVFTLGDARNIVVIRIADEGQEAALAAIDSIWQELIPDFPIQRSFLADSYAAFYFGESRTFALFIGLSAIAVLIACLGLFGLASYIAQRRTKEISIRKVLGATVASIAGMLAWDFSRLVIMANLVAWPLAWWSMQQWLSNFAYRTDINISIFLIAGIATFVMALATTFQRAYSVATSNPIAALRSE